MNLRIDDSGRRRKQVGDDRLSHLLASARPERANSGTHLIDALRILMFAKMTLAIKRSPSDIKLSDSHQAPLYGIYKRKELFTSKWLARFGEFKKVAGTNAL